MRWTREVLLTRALSCGRRSRVVLTPRRWRQVLWRYSARRRWQKSPVAGESTKETVKTIARGMPGETGVTVVTTLVYFVFYRTRGCGRIERPAFPAPSFQREPDQNTNLARKHAARSRSYVLPSLREIPSRGALRHPRMRLRAKSTPRHGQRGKPRNIRAPIERPDRRDQRLDVVPGVPASGSRSQFLFQITVAHRIDVAAARGGLRQFMRNAVGGGNLDSQRQWSRRPHRARPRPCRAAPAPFRRARRRR